MPNTILLVEGNSDDMALTLRAIRKATTSPVVIAQDGREALELLFGAGCREGQELPVRPDLVLLDLKLTKLDGFEVLKRVKEDIRTRVIPVIVVSASSEPEKVLKAYSLGANGYLGKSVDFGKFTKDIGLTIDYWTNLSTTARHLSISCPVASPVTRRYATTAAHGKCQGHTQARVLGRIE